MSGDRHATKALTAPDGECVEVDVELAAVIQELWDADIETWSCCQDAADFSPGFLKARPHLAEQVRYNVGYAYIDFPDEEEATAFLDAVANAGPRDDFYVRMAHWSAPGAWRKGVSFRDEGMYDLDDQGEVPSPSRFVTGSFKVTFPISDIAEIEWRLRRHNRRMQASLN